MQRNDAGGRQGRSPFRSRILILTIVVLVAGAGIVIKAVVLAPRPPEIITPDSTTPPSGQVLVVDGTSRAASDTNPGTAARPLKTMGRAAALAASNNLRSIATRIQIRPGVYRESVTLGAWRGQTSAPISFEGPTRGAAVLSGSDVWTGWTRVEGTNHYQHAWPHRWGLTPLPSGWTSARLPDIARHRELVFANGRLLRQVLTPDELHEFTGGAFVIDEANGLVTIRLREGQDIDKTRIEVATRQQVLLINGRENVRVDNLTFQHAASPLQQPAVRVERSSNIQITKAKFMWNNWTGLALNNDSNVTIRKSIFNHNGSMGFSALRVNTLRMDSTRNSYNAWRGHWGGWYGWENGMKLIGVHRATMRHHTATGNHSYGLWLDTDNSDVSMRNLTISNNRLAGLFLEASQGPITVDRATIKRNGLRGIAVANARDVTISNSRILKNAEAQITLSGVQAGLAVRDWESNQTVNVQSTGWRFRNNTIQAVAGQLLVDNTWSATTWATIRPTYTWTKNKWISPTGASFRLLGTYRLGTLSDWQAHTGLDTGSTQREPAG